MDRYRKIRPVGKGSYGAALLVEHISDKALYVMKTVDISRLTKSERDDARNEVKVLKALEHPNVIYYRESFTSRGKLCIVMEYADGGDLEGALKARRGKLLDENTVIDWFVQICLGLKHVHDKKILHRDLKTQNIFLTKSGMLKLGDFGISKVLANTGELAKTAIGTPYYLSPEICRQEKYGDKSDIWSLGCILYEIAALKHAFEASDMRHLVVRILKGKYNPLPRQYSSGLSALVAEMLNVNPGARPSVNRLLTRPVIRGRIQELLSAAALNDGAPSAIRGAPAAAPAGSAAVPPGIRLSDDSGKAKGSAFAVVGVGASRPGAGAGAGAGASGDDAGLRYEAQRAMVLAHAQQAALLADKVRRDELAGAQAAAKARVKAAKAKKRQQEAAMMEKLMALEQESAAAEAGGDRKDAAALVRAVVANVEAKRARGVAGDGSERRRQRRSTTSATSSTAASRADAHARARLHSGMAARRQAAAVAPPVAAPAAASNRDSRGDGAGRPRAGDAAAPSGSNKKSRRHSDYPASSARRGGGRDAGRARRRSSVDSDGGGADKAAPRSRRHSDKARGSAGTPPVSRAGPGRVPKPTPKYTRASAKPYHVAVESDRKPRRSATPKSAATPPPLDVSPAASAPSPAPAPAAAAAAAPSTPPSSNGKLKPAFDSPSLGEWKDVFDGLDSEIREVMAAPSSDAVVIEAPVAATRSGDNSPADSAQPYRRVAAPKAQDVAVAAREKLAGKTAAMRRKLIANKAKEVHDDWQQRLADMWATNGLMERLSELRGDKPHGRRPSAVAQLDMEAVRASPGHRDAPDRPLSARDQTAFQRTGRSLAGGDGTDGRVTPPPSSARRTSRRRRSSVHSDSGCGTPSGDARAGSGPRGRRLSWSGSVGSSGTDRRRTGSPTSELAMQEKARRLAALEQERRQKAVAGTRALHARRLEKQRRAEEKAKHDEELRRKKAAFEAKRREAQRKKAEDKQRRQAALERRRAAARAKYEGASFKSPSGRSGDNGPSTFGPVSPVLGPRRGKAAPHSPSSGARKPRVGSAGTRKPTSTGKHSGGSGNPGLRCSSSSGEGDDLRAARRAAREAAQADLRAKIREAKAAARARRATVGGDGADADVQVFAKPPPSVVRGAASQRSPGDDDPAASRPASLWTPSEEALLGRSGATADAGSEAPPASAGPRFGRRAAAPPAVNPNLPAGDPSIYTPIETSAGRRAKGAGGAAAGPNARRTLSLDVDAGAGTVPPPAESPDAALRREQRERQRLQMREAIRRARSEKQQRQAAPDSDAGPPVEVFVPRRRPPASVAETAAKVHPSPTAEVVRVAGEPGTVPGAPRHTTTSAGGGSGAAAAVVHPEVTATPPRPAASTPMRDPLLSTPEASTVATTPASQDRSDWRTLPLNLTLSESSGVFTGLEQSPAVPLSTDSRLFRMTAGTATAGGASTGSRGAPNWLSPSAEPLARQASYPPHSHGGRANGGGTGAGARTGGGGRRRDGRRRWSGGGMDEVGLPEAEPPTASPAAPPTPSEPDCLCDHIRRVSQHSLHSQHSHPSHHSHRSGRAPSPPPPARVYPADTAAGSVARQPFHGEVLSSFVAQHDHAAVADRNARRAYDHAHSGRRDRPGAFTAAAVASVREAYPPAQATGTTAAAAARRGGSRTAEPGGRGAALNTSTDAVPGGSPAGVLGEFVVPRPVAPSASQRSFLGQMGAVTIAGLPVDGSTAAAAAVAKAVGDTPSAASGHHKAEAIRMHLENELGAGKLVAAHRLLMSAHGSSDVSAAELDEQLLRVVGDEHAKAVHLLHQLVGVERQLSA